MKRKFITIVLTCIATAILVGCGGGIKPKRISVITFSFDDYEGISNSIDMICESVEWSDSLFIVAVNGIDGAASNSIIDKDLFQDRDLKEKLMNKSCSRLLANVDSTMKCSVYNNLKRRESEYTFLKEQIEIFINYGVKLQPDNENLNICRDMLDNYYRVDKLAGSTCYKKEVYLEPYSFDVSYIRRLITQNKYYSSHFKNNNSIINRMNGLEARSSEQAKSYMVRLEPLVESNALRDSLSLSELLQIQRQFNTMADNVKEQTSKAKLSAFVNDYVDPTIEDDTSNDTE